MKKFFLWLMAIIITLSAAYYQRKTGPTNPKSESIVINGTTYDLRLIRSLGLDERPEVKLAVDDTTITARLLYKRFRTNDAYSVSDFTYRVYPVDSFVMNRIFNISEEKGFFAAVPEQPPAGKLEYYIEITDREGVKSLLKESPLVIRFKGAVPSWVLAPHILFMFLAMLLSTLSGLMALAKHPLYKKYSILTLVVLGIGGMILGPLVQKFAFGEFWTGVPMGWDLTDNKTLIAFIFWIIAVLVNRKKEKPIYTIIASVVLLIIFSIPHSLFGSELDFESGEVTQGLILLSLFKISKNS
ncbi:MAG: hypothetical protein RBT38_13345 [Bacteroidales bacterium]|jgi:hypothetical protein|nr:hypothetical protein [Bacteroidales bacterium]